MKLIFGVTIVSIIAIVNIVTSESSSEEDDDRYDIMLQCQNETGASDKDVEQIYHRILPTTKSGKCLSACVLNKMEIMSKELLVPENLIEYVSDETLIGSSGKTLDDSIKEVADECKKVSDPDRCESAAKILTCLNSAVKKRGFCPNVF